MTHKQYILIGLTALLFASCHRTPIKERTDTMKSGQAKVACDACFLPFMRDEVAIFEGLNPEATITPIYTTDEAAIGLLLKDSLRLVVAARDLTKAEYQKLNDMKLLPRAHKIAVDGIAMIVNTRNNDTIISVSNLKKIMTGEINSWNQLDPKSKLGKIHVVFDNPGSSTVRYIKDTLCGNKPFSENIKAKLTNEAVIEYVSKMPGAIGVVSSSWICDPTDTLNLHFINKIHVMSVSPYDDANAGNSYKPFAAWLALKNYPLTRDIYIISSDAHGYLPSGFMNFVGGDKGQRLILKSGLFPANRPARLVEMKPDNTI